MPTGNFSFFEPNVIRTKKMHTFFINNLIQLFCLRYVSNVNEQRNILHEIKKRKANWIGHILRRNCLLKHVIEGKLKGEMEVT